MNEEDYKISTLILAKALAFLLKENEGVAIIPENDIEEMLGTNNPLVIFNQDGKIRVQAGDAGIEDGQMVWVHKKEQE